MCFELVYVLGGAMCKGSPWGVRVVAGAESGVQSQGAAEPRCSKKVYYNRR
jgi:hypothetical protein